MLTLTENVTNLVKNLTAEGPDTAGLRISTEEDGQALAVTAADQPQPDDQVVSQDGAQVYLDAPAAQLLDDKQLDAGVDEQGNVQFGLTEQAGLV